MSQEWVDLVREGFEALQRGEMAMFDGMTTPDLVLVQPPEVPDAKTYEGRDAIAEAMEDWPRQWEDFRMDLIETASRSIALQWKRYFSRNRRRPPLTYACARRSRPRIAAVAASGVAASLADAVSATRRGADPRRSRSSRSHR